MIQETLNKLKSLLTNSSQNELLAKNILNSFEFEEAYFQDPTVTTRNNAIMNYSKRAMVKNGTDDKDDALIFELLANKIKKLGENSEIITYKVLFPKTSYMVITSVDEVLGIIETRNLNIGIMNELNAVYKEKGYATTKLYKIKK